MHAKLSTPLSKQHARAEEMDELPFTEKEKKSLKKQPRNYISNLLELEC